MALAASAASAKAVFTLLAQLCTATASPTCISACVGTWYFTAAGTGCSSCFTSYSHMMASGFALKKFSAVQCGPATAEGFGAASQVATQLSRAVNPAEKALAGTAWQRAEWQHSSVECRQ